MTIEPIHRVLFGTDASKWMQAAEAALASADGSGYAISLIAGNQRRDILAKGASLGEAIAAMDTFCAAYLAENGGTVDYIHGDDEALGRGAARGGPHPLRRRGVVGPPLRPPLRNPSLGLATARTPICSLTVFDYDRSNFECFFHKIRRWRCFHRRWDRPLRTRSVTGRNSWRRSAAASGRCPCC